MLFLGLALAFLVVGLIGLWWSRRRWAAAGLPHGQIVYADVGDAFPVQEALYDPQLRLVGRPDYLVRQGRTLIPVEVKSGRAPARGPYRSHLLQLAAYCHLVEAQTGHRPPYGLIRYADRTVAVNYTPALREHLVQTLARLRADRQATEVHRDHHQPARCRACGYRDRCDEALA